MTELDQLSNRLLESAKKYKESLAAMLKHQESFAKTLLEVYQPIQGRFPGGHGTLGSTMPRSSSTYTEGGDMAMVPMGSHTMPRKDRPVTPEASLKRAQDFLEACAKIAEILLPKLDVIIERQVIKPTFEYCQIHKQVAKTALKRDHKKIDYDRHLNAYNKAKQLQQSAGNGQAGGFEEERKLMKLHANVETAQRDYENYNQLLKSQLPVYIQNRIQFIDPVLETMVVFQDHYFSSLCTMLQPLKGIVDMSTSAVDGYVRKRDFGVQKIDEIRLIKDGYIKRRVSGEVSSSVGAIEGASSASLDRSPKKSFASSPAINSPPPFYAPPTVPAAQYQQNSQYNTSSGPGLDNSNPFSYQQSSGSLNASNNGFNNYNNNVVPIHVPPPKPMKPQSLTAPQMNMYPAAASPQLQATPLNPYGTVKPRAPAPPPPPSHPRLKQAKVLYDFDAQQPGDLTLRTGQIIEIVEMLPDANSWWKGRAGGQEGSFPGNYVQFIN